MSGYKGCAVVLGILVCGMSYADEPPAKQTPAEVMHVTEANLRGHQSLYREGWFIITSTEQTLSYAKEHALISSGQAMSRAVADAREHSAAYGKDMLDAGKGSVETGKQVISGGTELSKQAVGLTTGMIINEWDYGSRNMLLAWERFIKGNMTLAQRTAADRQALAALPGGWYKNLKSDFSNVYELTDAAKEVMSTHIEGRWSEAFGEAKADFNQSYQESGTRGNSLSSLGDIMAGYLKVLYSGLIKPASRSAVQGAEGTVNIVAKVIFLPVAGLFIVSGRTIESTGLSLYYTTALGIELVSPTVEGGLLSGLSMLSYGAVPVTAAVGYSAGAVNQVAVMAAAPVAGAGEAVAVGAANTGVYAARVSYDLFTGITKVAMNQAQAGIALGYNALTALPTQMLLGTANGIVFLAWDGPRLVVASVKGEVQWSDSDTGNSGGKVGNNGSVPVLSLPVGSVVDLNALRKEQGVQVQIISDDPVLVQKVLEKLPDDLREGGHP